MVILNIPIALCRWRLGKSKLISVYRRLKSIVRHFIALKKNKRAQRLSTNTGLFTSNNGPD
jgi:hypothetical protein